MTIALIITSLLLLFTYWRKRVWKRRFIQRGGMTYPQAFARGWNESRANTNRKDQYTNEWPDFIGQ